jgi:hypothetical protein
MAGGNFRIDVVVSGGAATGTGAAIPASLAVGLSAARAGGFLNNSLGNMNMRGMPFDPASMGAKDSDYLSTTKGIPSNIVGFGTDSAKAMKQQATFTKYNTKLNRVYSGESSQVNPSDPLDVATVPFQAELESGINSYLRKGGFNKYSSEQQINAMKSRGLSLSMAIAAKTAYSAIQYAQHTSGDSYYNQQLSNATRFGSYTFLLANSGVAAPFVAAGIVANEGIQAVLDVAKFDFDRKMERYEITNNMITAGNASYGRMRGVGV